MTTCPKCGMTLEELSKVQRMGCANCYNIFRDVIRQLLEPTQIRYRHEGKVPERTYRGEQLDKLNRQMKRAAERDDFETAARLRDEIKAMKHAQPI